VATRPCQLCGERPADLLVSLTSTGESEFICLLCAPFRVAEYWQVAGMPRLILDVADRDTEATGVAPTVAPEPEAESAPDGPEWPPGTEPRLHAVNHDPEPPGGRRRPPRAKRPATAPHYPTAGAADD
jgi:hypothetical protein